jgi:hypothetical protein
VISEKTESATVLAVDRLDRAGPGDVVTVNMGTLVSPTSAVLVAELAATWPSALTTMSAGKLTAGATRYLASVEHGGIENIFEVGLSVPMAHVVLHALGLAPTAPVVKHSKRR